MSGYRVVDVNSGVDWPAIEAQARQDINDPGLRMSATLKLVSALRAQCRGQEANRLLESLPELRVESSVELWGLYAEECLQACLWKSALHAIALLNRVDSARAEFLGLVSLREREDWPSYDCQFDRLMSAKGAWTQAALLQQVRAFLRRGYLARAVDVFRPFEHLKDHRVQRIAARIYLTQGRLQQASHLLHELYSAHPGDWELLALLGALGGKEQLARYDDSLLRQPNQPDTLVRRAALYLQSGRPEPAQRDLATALQLKPWMDEPVLQQTQYLIHQHRFEDADRWLSSALEQWRTAARYAASLDLARIAGKSRKEVLAITQQALQEYPFESAVLLSAGVAYQAMNRRDEAIECYEKLAQIAPEDWRYRNNLAQLWREDGDLETAIDIWRGIASTAGAPALLNLSSALIELGELAEAEAILRNELSQRPEDVIARRGLADILAASGDINAARGIAQTLVKQEPEEWRNWKLLSTLELASGDADRAEQNLVMGQAAVQKPLTLRRQLAAHWCAQGRHLHLLEQSQAWLDAADEGDIAQYLFMQADAHLAANDYGAVERVLRAAMTLDIDEGAPALIRFLESRARFGAARREAEMLVREHPHIARHHGLLAEVLQQQQRVEEALKAIDAGLKLHPNRLALVRQKVGQLMAIERYDQALVVAQQQLNHEFNPQHISMVAKVLARQHRYAEISALMEQAVERKPENLDFVLALAGALAQEHRDTEALRVLRDCAATRPENVRVASAFIRQLRKLDMDAEALAVAQTLVRGTGFRPEQINAVAALLVDQEFYQEAQRLLAEGMKQYPHSLSLRVQMAKAKFLQGDTVGETEVWDQVLQDFPVEQALTTSVHALVRLRAVNLIDPALEKWRLQRPDDIRRYRTAMIAAKGLRRFDVGLDIAARLIARLGAKADILHEKAQMLSEQWRMTEAIETQRQAVELKPTHAALIASLINLQIKAGDYTEFDRHFDTLRHLWGDRQYRHYEDFFFNINCHPEWSAEQIWSLYDSWYRRTIEPRLPLPKAYTQSFNPARKLRVAYLSPDFRRHAVAYFSEPMLIKHDRHQFELFAFAHIEAGMSDQYTERFKTYFDHWFDITHITDDELVRKIRKLEIDILVDLAGHTTNNRLAVMYQRPAPVQVASLVGAGQTTGVRVIDYLMGSADIVPPGHRRYIAEAYAALSHKGAPFMPAHDVLPPAPLPCISSGQVTFCVLSRPLRTNPASFACWARILHLVPGSVLRFDHVPYMEPDIQARFVAAFECLGITAERLLFHNTRPHWRAYQEIDIQLDPFPAGSGTTATEGLYMERLVITLRSRPPMGRGSAGQLDALGLADMCVADSADEYVAKAVRLATDIPLLRHLSEGLRKRFEESPLMDYAGYGVDIARTYRKMWQDRCAQEASP